MKRSSMGLVLATVIALSFGASLVCEAGDICSSQRYHPTAHPYGHNGPGPWVNSGGPQAPERKIHTLPRSQALQPLPQSALPWCGPIPQKVREWVAPQPECGPKLVPLYFRDPGPIKPIIQHIIGLAGATVALPFRMAETLCPLPQKMCGPTIVPPCRPIAPVPPELPVCGQPPVPPCSAAPACLTPLVCGPVGPAVAPLPPVPCGPPCGPNLPPGLVEEYQFPQLEAQDLLSGIWNFPGRLIRNGRFAGDIHKTSAPACR